MKGDWMLLGTVGAAMVAVPAAVLLWMGQPLLGEAPVLPVSLGGSAAHSPAKSQSSSPRPQDAGQEGKENWDRPGVSAVPAESIPAQGEADFAGEETLPDTVKGKWQTPVNTLKIYDQTTGEVAELTLEEYTLAAMAAEMPADYHLEALKAQGVAALSYALHEAVVQRSLPEENKNPSLHGADFAADPQNRKGYMTKETAREFYGEQFDYSWNKLTEAARTASRCVALYDGEPIAAAYHAISAGDTTESAENIWGGELPYLVEADSSWDILAPGYKSTVSVSDEELKAALTGAGATLLPDPATWLAVEERSPAGYVTAVRAGSLTLHGNQLRNLLGLRSAAFELERTHTGYTFYVRGYGHGAGLSQAGADYLARQGQTFDEILLHYYTGVTLAQVEK